MTVALSEIDEGSRGFVRHLRGGRRFVSRMAALGFTVGEQVTIIQNRHHGPLMVKVRDTRVALGRGEAKRVEVEASQHDN